MSREAPCGTEDGRTISRVARTYLNLAEIASATREPEAAYAAAGNAVLAAIAASDDVGCGGSAADRGHRITAWQQPC